MSKETENIERLMSKKGMQFRDFQITPEKRAGEEGEPDGLTVKGVPIVFDSETVLFSMDGIDYCEVVDRHALDDCDMSDVIFNMNHGGRVYARTRNNSLRLSVEDDGLHMEADLWPDDDGHRALYRDIDRGNLDRMSFAFTVVDEEYKDRSKEEQKYVRVIKGIDHLYDVSAVDIPAYDATSISARSAFEAESERRHAESEKAESRKREEERRHRLAIALRLKYMEDEYDR